MDIYFDNYANIWTSAELALSEFLGDLPSLSELELETLTEDTHYQAPAADNLAAIVRNIAYGGLAEYFEPNGYPIPRIAPYGQISHSADNEFAILPLSADTYFTMEAGGVSLGRIVYNYTLTVGNLQYDGNDIESGVNAPINAKESMRTLCSFLSSCRESLDHSDLFPEWVMMALESFADNISIASAETGDI